MLKKVAILANGGDVSGFNAVIRAIIKTAENNNVECYVTGQKFTCQYQWQRDIERH